jgi:hypothetical protein
MIPVGMRCISSARMVFGTLYPAEKTSRAKRLVKNANRMHRILGVQKRTRFVVLFIMRPPFAKI